MIQNVEITSFDMRYEGYRMRNARAEKELLISISENGIREPLQGVDSKDKRILLNGFKRYRCSKKLGIGIVPFSSLGSDEAYGIIQLIRIANSKSLGMLEQAKLIDELISEHKMCVSDIASLLEKSKAWVSMRVGIIGEISECVMRKIFNGEFPVYSYMYTLRPFIRMNGVKKEEIDEFVSSIAGRNLSIREIEGLAHGFFKGSDEFREQIKRGDIAWGLRRLKEVGREADDCNEFERGMLRDLEIVQKFMQRVTCKSKDRRLTNKSFYAQANLLAGGIVRQIDVFSKAIRDFHDRSGQA